MHQGTRTSTVQAIDHTGTAETPEVIRLNGYRNVTEGPGKTLRVMPGDKVKIAVYAKYLDMRRANDKTTAAALLSAVMQAAGGAIVPGDPAQAMLAPSSMPTGAMAGLGTAGTAPPKAFLNYYLFDNNFNAIDAGFVQVSEAAAVTAENVDGAHEKLVMEVNVTEPGYLFTNLSHNAPENVEVYFDDYTVTHEHGPIVQVQDFYPYGLAFNGNIKDHAVLNKYLYQGKERLDSLGWDDFHARMYSPALGRFLGVDPAGQFASGFVGMGNNPVVYVDPDGKWIHIAIGAVVGGAINLAMNWDNIDNPWEGVAAFGIGAGAGAATAACGSCGSALWIAAAGGAATSATNNIIAQTGNGVGLNDVNWESVGISAGVGGVSGLAGYGAGKWATNSLGNPLINKLNVKGPAVSGLINGTIGGAAGGAGGGFAGGFLLSGGDIGAGLEGAWNGFTNGAIIGGGTGLGMGYYQARRSNVDPWSGKSLTPNAKGDLGVQKAIKDIQKMGGEVLQKRPAGYRVNGRRGYTDLLVKIKGEIVIVEVKYGDGARLNSNQKINYGRINQGDFPTFTGPNGQVVPPGTTNIKVIIIHYTSQGRIIYSPYR